MKKIHVLIFLIAVIFLSSISAKAQQTYCPPNINFENGSFNYWLCNVGNVTQGTTGNPAILTYPSTLTGPSATQHVLKSSGLDTFGKFPTVCNYINGNHFSVRLGDDQVGAVCARMRYKVNVPINNSHYKLTFYYALVFQNPKHSFEAQPGFKVTIIDSATNLAVNLGSNFLIVQPPSGKLPGFNYSTVASGGMFDSIYYKNWAASTLNFSGLSGKTIYVQFDAFDCAQGGHFGYAYVDLPDNCNSSKIIQTANCTSSNIPQLVAPGGYSAYQWYDSSFTNLLSTNDTLTISTTPIDTSLHYCVLTPFNNWGCMDTALVRYNPSPSAVANFNYPTSYCVNSAAHFIDNSYTTISGAYINKWAWNFGDINATANNPNTDSIQNATHIYSAMGNYTVCLIAHSNINCLADTICQTININRIAPISIIKFTKDSICGLGDTTTIYPISPSIAGYTYQWVIDPNAIVVSGNLSACLPIILKYKTTGNHTIQLIATPPSTDTNCATTAIIQVYVKAMVPNFSIIGVDSVCINQPIALTINNIPSVSGASLVNCSSTNQTTIGQNNATSLASNPSIFNGGCFRAKVQMIYTKAELNSAGFYGGVISQVAWNVITKYSNLPFQGFSIKIGCISPLLLLPQTIDTSSILTLVYSSNSYTSFVGMNNFILSTPYSWNGTTNLLVEICFDNGFNSSVNSDVVAKSSMASYGFCNYCPSNSNILNGCDPHFTDYAILSNERPDLTFTFCNGGQFASNVSYSWNSIPISISSSNSTILDTISSNKIYSVIIDDNGCIGTNTHTVKIATTFNNTIYQTVCGGSTYNYHGRSYNNTGTYLDTVKSLFGCDSITTINLSFIYYFKFISATTCNSTPYFFNGTNLTSSGVYLDTISSTTNGCDTIVLLSLYIAPTTQTTYIGICPGQYFYYNGINYNQIGTYLDTIRVGSCIILDTLVLTKSLPKTFITGNFSTLTANNSSNNISYYQWINCQDFSFIQNANYQTFIPTTSGSYAVIVYGGGCADTSACYNFNPYCFAHYSTNYDSINNSFIVTVDTLTALLATSYLWNFGDGTTSTSATPTHVYTVDTTYTVCLQIVTAIGDTCNYCHVIGKDYQGHIIKHAGFTINIKNPISLGIVANLTHDNHFSIYPNPVNEWLTINGKWLMSNTIVVTNLLGQQQNIVAEKLTTDNYQLNTDHLPSGVYFIKATDKNGNVMNGKFVKE
ncbi:MAG: hypothetical protein RJA07_1683 [Bacteroidota bacterium]|jgi:PKD repeat protein